MAEEHHHHHLFHHKKEDETPVEAVAYTETATYGGPTNGGYGGYSQVEAVVVETPVEPEVDYRKEEKHHKRHEHLGELGATAAGAYALVIIIYKKQNYI